MAKKEEIEQEEVEKQEMPVEEAKKEKKSPAVKLSLITLFFTLLIFVWYVLSDRHTPNTDQARVKGLVLPVAPMVSGYITKVNVGLHTLVNKGDTLFIVDTAPYKIAVDIAESSLESAIQSVSSGESSIKSATARLSRARVKLDRDTKNWERTQRVIAEHKGALSEADKDRSEASYLEAIEGVASAEAELKRQIDAIGPIGENNPNIKSAISQLEKAQLDLAYTAVTATSDGIIESFNIEVGYFASAGSPLVSLVSNSNIWIQANLKENNLSKLKLGNEVELIFDIQPGKVFKGKVSSVAYGVSVDQNNPSDLPSVSTSQGWLRDPQRFPVIIDILDEEIKPRLLQGGQAELVVYTGDKSFLNWLAKVRIRIMSYLSYVR